LSVIEAAKAESRSEQAKAAENDAGRKSLDRNTLRQNRRVSGISKSRRFDSLPPSQFLESPASGSVLMPAAVDVVHRSVLQHCGGKGVDEGLVADPRRCAWSPSMAACPSGALREDCLAPTQVHAIDRLMTSPTNSRGDVIYRYSYLP